MSRFFSSCISQLRKEGTPKLVLLIDLLRVQAWLKLH